jgi:curved DNA-binding protein
MFLPGGLENLLLTVNDPLGACVTTLLLLRTGVVSPHDYFQIEGNDIAVKLPITPSEAVLGNPVEVPTLDGLVQMNLPAGVRSGQRLRLANKGYIDDEGRRGDQLVEIQIVTPKTISPQEKELYEKLRRIETFNPRAELFE